MNSQGLRVAAVKLASLHPADREWLLGKLQVSQSSAVRALLKRRELRRLARQVHELPTLPLPKKPVDAPTVFVASSSRLDALGPAWAALWLSTAEPGELDHYLAQVDLSRSQRTIEASRKFNGSLPPKLAAAVAAWAATDAPEVSA